MSLCLPTHENYAEQIKILIQKKREYFHRGFSREGRKLTL
jgi:hypothetical protein